VHEPSGLVRVRCRCRHARFPRCSSFRDLRSWASPNGRTLRAV